MKRILKNGKAEPTNNNSKIERKKTEQYQRTTNRIKDKIDMGRSKTYHLTLSRKDDKIRRSCTYTKIQKTETSSNFHFLMGTEYHSKSFSNMGKYGEKLKKKVLKNGILKFEHFFFVYETQQKNRQYAVNTEITKSKITISRRR